MYRMLKSAVGSFRLPFVILTKINILRDNWNYIIQKKVKQSHYRSGQALRVPGG
jgi:hypothetical protein